MVLKLRADMHYCMVGETAIFMDIQRGRYFSLSTGLNELFRSISEDLDGEGANSERGRPLLDEGLLVAMDEELAFSHPTQIIRATADVRSQTRSKATSFLIAEVLVGQMLTRRLLRKSSLRDLIETVRGWKRAAQRRRPGGTQYGHLISAFEASAMIFHPSDQCLAKAVAFLRVCSWRGLNPSLVFGVRTNPFTAHCWIQDGPLAINDDVDRVSIYEPILVV